MQAIENTAACGQYVDGVYTGSASGYKGTTTVQVTVENGYITDVEVISTDDDREFFAMAESSIIAGILSTQSTDVDTVTGATFSSNAILNAVSDALDEMGSCSSMMNSVLTEEDASETESGTFEAETETETSQVEAETEEAGDSTTAQAETDAASEEITVTALEDGVYSGTGTGFRGETTVSVTVSDGVITDIAVESYQDDREYFVRAEDTMIERILSAQSVDVDTVSGATFSSNGILEAVANALGQEFESSTVSSGGEGQRGGHGHGG